MRVMMPYFESIGEPYSSTEACYDDRVNHRDTWFQQIERYNTPNWDRAAKEILAYGYDVHIGMRSRKEFEASKHLYDYIIWVDAADRVPPESSSSMELNYTDAQYHFGNNGTKDDLEIAVNQFVWDIQKGDTVMSAIVPEFGGLPPKVIVGISVESNAATDAVAMAFNTVETLQHDLSQALKAAFDETLAKHGIDKYSNVVRCTVKSEIAHSESLTTEDRSTYTDVYSVPAVL